MALRTTNLIFINLGFAESLSVGFGPSPLGSHFENFLLRFVGIFLLQHLKNITAIQTYSTIPAMLPHSTPY